LENRTFSLFFPVTSLQLSFYSYVIWLLTNLNASKNSNINGTGQNDTPQMQTIKFAAWQNSDREGQEGASSNGFSSFLRSLGTMSIRRSAAGINTAGRDTETHEVSLASIESSISYDDASGKVDRVNV
jgi:hypothetical protein